MTNATLDTNCIIDLENNARAARYIRALIRMHEDRRINLRVVAISASERKRDRTYAANFSEFKERIAAIGLGGVEILRPILYWGMAYWDWCIWAGHENDPMMELERRVHEILFPEIQFSYKEFCKKNSIDINGALDPRWRNAKCDVLAMWSHIYYGGDVFVTRDSNFLEPTKKSLLVTLGAGEILEPNEAVTRLAEMTSEQDFNCLQ